MKNYIFIIFLFMSFVLFSQNNYIRLHEIEIKDEKMIKLIEEFILFEKDNCSYYNDSLSIVIIISEINKPNYECNIIQIESELLGLLDTEYGYYLSGNHYVFFSGRGNLEGNIKLTNRSKLFLNERKGKEISEDDSSTQWVYIFKDNKYVEYLKVCPTCSK